VVFRSSKKPKLCVDCKFYEPLHHGGGEIAFCLNPDVAGVSLVNGVPHRVFCNIERQVLGRCGHRAKYFTPKEIE
jgi:hypothetical protein